MLPKKKPVLESLFNKVAGLNVCIFIKKETATQMLSCEYCEMFKNSFFYRTPPDHCTFPKFYVVIDSLYVFGYKIDIFLYFLCHCFVFFHNSIRISISWLFRSCFHTKIVTHYNVGPSTILIESLKFRNNSRITVTSPSNLLWKLWILCIVIIFLKRWSCKAWLKISLSKK